jgi:hypothetical protein
VVLDQADLAHAGLELGGAADVVDRGQLAQQVGDLGTGVAREVRAHPGAQVLGLADVQHPPAGVAEQVHARRVRQPVGQVDLLEGGVGPCRRELDQVLEGEHAERAGQLQQAVEDVDGGPGVGERSVAGRHRGTQIGGEGGQPDVGHLVPGQQLACQPSGADHPVGRPRVSVPLQVGLQEPPVEGGVVADEHGVAEEFEQAGQDRLDRLRARHHAVGDPGERGDQRRDRDLGVDQRVERADDLAAADLDGADLGDAVVRGRAAGGLEVQDDELDLDERRTKVVQGQLDCWHARGPPSWEACLTRPFLPFGRGRYGEHPFGSSIRRGCGSPIWKRFLGISSRVRLRLRLLQVM